MQQTRSPSVRGCRPRLGQDRTSHFPPDDWCEPSDVRGTRGLLRHAFPGLVRRRRDGGSVHLPAYGRYKSRLPTRQATSAYVASSPRGSAEKRQRHAVHGEDRRPHVSLGAAALPPTARELNHTWVVHSLWTTRDQAACHAPVGASFTDRPAARGDGTSSASTRRDDRVRP